MLQLNKDKRLSRLIENYIQELFNERQVSEAMQQKLWQFYYNKLAKGIDKGYGQNLETFNPQLALKLKYNVAEFSAFKATSFKKELESRLTKNGRIVPWSSFKKEAARVSGLYNVNYLQTEYHQTIATANMAGKWEDFQKNKDLYPNLRYEAVDDERTRTKHRALDGFVAPIDHPIWKTLYPPIDWGCRCDVVQTDEPVSKDLPEINIKETFKNNAAQSGEIFSDIPYQKGLDKASADKASIMALRYMIEYGDEASKRHAEQLILSLPRKKQYTEIYNHKKGLVLEHLLVNKKADDYTEILESAKLLAHSNKVVEMLPEVKGKSVLKYRNTVFHKYDLSTNPDLRVAGVYMDVKRPQAIKNILRNANKASDNQNCVAIIYLADSININTKILNNRVNDIFESPNYKYDVVYFVIKGKLFKFNRP
ncbi:phage minor head protein [Pseudotamlana carrageenivorans]|uniref:Uncharacterized protein n=1 Tax=Pseudotamlana carrageenivorans TaxID=2069432 RepID=A0A2I7SKT2_9FLAO|nr:phage minor head protein [Tamlana carrageenivorans]AUS06467.1 hypothetical protein C1A40_13885 [Tamlana carrageenivorans]